MPPKISTALFTNSVGKDEFMIVVDLSCSEVFYYAWILSLFVCHFAFICILFFLLLFIIWLFFISFPGLLRHINVHIDIWNSYRCTVQQTIVGEADNQPALCFMHVSFNRLQEEDYVFLDFRVMLGKFRPYCSCFISYFAEQTIFAHFYFVWYIHDLCYF